MRLTIDTVRRALGGLLAALGVYYCVLSAWTLLHLPAVTGRWTRMSGDPDFKYDFGLFFLLSLVGLLLIAVLGVSTAATGLAAARGRRTSWLGLVVGSIVLHPFWFVYRVIGSGIRDADAMTLFMRNQLLWFGAVCAAYVVMWLVTRSRLATVLPDDYDAQPTTGALSPQ